MYATNHRVLVIDDEEALLFGFRKVLQSPQINVDTSSSLENATHLILARQYTVIIADLMLTNTATMEGLEIVQIVKKLQPKSRIIVITAYGKSEAEEKAKDLGADYYLEKPVSPGAIKKIIEEM